MIATPALETTPLFAVSKTPLEGEELLRAISVEPLKSVSIQEAAAACGYISDKGRVQTARFCKAVLHARGLFTGTRISRGKAPSYSTRVGVTGAVVVGPAYVRQLKAEPGDAISIAVSRNRIILTLGAGDNDSETLTETP